MNIDAIFVDENKDIIDLEKNNGEVISDFLDYYNKTWSEAYYVNIKDKINVFRKNKVSV